MPNNRDNPRDGYFDPVDTDDFREMARRYTRKALDTLDEVMSDADAKSASRVRAAEVMLAHGHGSPERRSTTNSTVTVLDARQAHLDALKEHSLKVIARDTPVMIDITPPKSQFEE